MGYFEFWEFSIASCGWCFSGDLTLAGTQPLYRIGLAVALRQADMLVQQADAQLAGAPQQLMIQRR